MKAIGFVSAGMLLLGVSGAIVTVQGGATAQEKGSKKASMARSEPESGAQLYKNYCAACHGIEGKGDGPVVNFLKVPPADLSTLAQRNDGKYPADRVAATLDSSTNRGPHGTSDMPIWGPVFRAKGKGVAQIRIQKLNAFIESLQQE
jgi:mono/diheme cytochrome c family protein